MDPAKLYRGPACRARRGQLIEGLRYVRGRPDLMTLMVLVFVVSTFGITFFSSLRDRRGQRVPPAADGYGLLSTMLAVGTLAGALHGGPAQRTRPAAAAGCCSPVRSSSACWRWVPG